MSQSKWVLDSNNSWQSSRLLVFTRIDGSRWRCFAISVSWSFLCRPLGPNHISRMCIICKQAIIIYILVCETVMTHQDWLSTYLAGTFLMLEESRNEAAIHASLDLTLPLNCPDPIFYRGCRCTQKFCFGDKTTCSLNDFIRQIHSVPTRRCFLRAQCYAKKLYCNTGSPLGCS